MSAKKSIIVNKMDFREKNKKILDEFRAFVYDVL